MATRAPTDIFHSNRIEMYRLTSARNTMRAMMAFREIVLPHVALTSWPLIPFTEIPAVRASALFSWSALNVGATEGLGDGAAVGEALGLVDASGDAEDVGLADADAEASGDAEADGPADAEAVADGEADGDGAAAVTPRSVRLCLVLIWTHPFGQFPPPMSSVSESATPNRAMIAW
jgi:hypothetical protein